MLDALDRAHPGGILEGVYRQARHAVVDEPFLAELLDRRRLLIGLRGRRAGKQPHRRCLALDLHRNAPERAGTSARTFRTSSSAVKGLER